MIKPFPSQSVADQYSEHPTKTKQDDVKEDIKKFSSVPRRLTMEEEN